jgi:carboxymethylenebutenolidase
MWAAAGAAGDEKPGHAEMRASIPVGDGSMGAFVARPGDPSRPPAPAPAVLVFHEGAGVDEDIEEHCRRLAREGYVAVAPELRHRVGGVGGGQGARGTQETEEAEEVSTLDLAREILAALAYVRSLDGVVPRDVGVVGFGLGGYAAFLLACRAKVNVAVVIYGAGIHRMRRSIPGELGTTRRAAPIRCILGAEDTMVDVRDVGTVGTRFAEYGVSHDIVVYPRVGSGFMSESRSSYRAAAAADAWERTLAWLRMAKSTRQRRAAAGLRRRPR